MIGAVAVSAGIISVSLASDDGEVKQEEKEENTNKRVCNQDGALATKFVVFPAGLRRMVEIFIYV